MTQEKLASEAGLVRSHISRIESGLVDARLSTVVRIGRVFGVEAVDLLIRY